MADFEKFYDDLIIINLYHIWLAHIASALGAENLSDYRSDDG